MGLSLDGLVGEWPAHWSSGLGAAVATWGWRPRGINNFISAARP